MSIRTIHRLAAVLGGMMFLAGCMSINAPKTVTFGGEGKGEARKISKTDANTIASGIVRDEGQNVKNFNITDQKTDDGWWVLFDHKINGYRLGWPYHFAVYVTPDGKGMLYRSKN